MLASFKAPRLPGETDNKSSEFSASLWPLCSLVWSQTYGDWLRATSFKLAGQECWLSAHLPLSFRRFQGAPTISLSCWYLSGPRLFFIAPTRKAIGHSKELWTWAKCRQIKEWEQKSYICQVKLGAKWLWSCWNGRGISPRWTSHEKTAHSSASSSQGPCESARVVCSLQYGSGGKKNNNGPENPKEIKMLIIEPLYC